MENLSTHISNISVLLFSIVWTTYYIAESRLLKISSLNKGMLFYSLELLIGIKPSSYQWSQRMQIQYNTLWIVGFFISLHRAVKVPKEQEPKLNTQWIAYHGIVFLLRWTFLFEIHSILLIIRWLRHNVVPN